MRSVAVNLEPTIPTGGDETTLGEQLGAAARLENVTAALGDEIFFKDRWFTPDPGFDPAQNLAPGEELDWRHLAPARSLAEMNNIRHELANERMLRQQLGDGPLPELLAGTLAVLSDPVTYIPFFGWGKGVASFGKLAVSVGLRGAGEVAASELALHAFQRTRTAQESAVAVMLGGAFGAGLGATIGGLSTRSYNAAVRDTLAIARADDPNFPPGPTSAGAMATPTVAPENTMLVSTGGLATAMSKMKGVVSPALEMASSIFATSRRFIADLVDIGTITDGNVRGFASSTPVEVAIRRHNAVDASLTTMMRTIYREHQATRGPDAMSMTNWMEVVGRTLRRGDVSPEPTVQKAAQEIRAKIIEPYKKLAIEAGLLPADVAPETAVSYFTRVYDRQKINANQPDFQRRIEGYLRANIKVEELAGDGEYALMAREIIHAINGGSAGRVPFLKVPKLRGPMKERTFNIPDEWIEPYLVSDVSVVMPRFIRTMAADIEMHKKFGTTAPGEDLTKQIDSEARDLMAKATTEVERQAIMKRAERDKAVIGTLVNRIRGVGGPEDAGYSGMKSVAKVLRDYNFVRLLGGTMLSSIPDVGQVIAQEGFFRTFGALTVDLARGFKGVRMGKKEAQLAGTALDMSRSQRIRAAFDLGERYETQNAFERGADKATQVFADVIGINLWNTTLKSATSMMASSRILSTVEKIANGTPLSKREQFRLRQSYIDDNMARRIAAQADKWDRHTGGVILGNTEAWDDLAAVDTFRNALLADVDRTILTPGAGDAPLWTGTEWGKTVFQFKRFSSAAMTRILLLNMQARDATALAGVSTMIGMGALSQMIRDVAANGEVKDRTAREWAVDAVDRSGVMALFMEGDALMDKFTGYSASRAVAGREPSRFQDRGKLAQLLGPTAGAIEDLSDAVLGATNGDFTQTDLRRIGRLVPGQNVFYLNYLFNQAEEGLGDAMGLPEQQARPSRGRLPNPAQP